MSTAANVADLNKGLIEAAQELGTPHAIYRPVAPLTSALDASNFQGQTLAAFPINYAYKAPIDPLKPRRVAITDFTLVEAGDYLKEQADGNTYFIGSIDTMQPVYAVICNCVASIYSQSNTGDNAGNVGRLGNVTVGAIVTETLKLANWPASALYSGRGPKTLSLLPTDDTAPQFTFLLPKLSVNVEISDLITVDDGRRFVVRSAETNAGGTRLITNQTVE